MTDTATDWGQAMTEADYAAADTGHADREAVQAELQRLRISAEARDLHRAEKAALSAPELPPVQRLADFLAIEDTEAEWIVDDLLARGANVLLASGHKAGKSTLTANLIRSIVDGALFLGRFTTKPRNIVLIDDELSDSTLRKWLRAHGIVNTDRVRLVSMRGATSTFNILDPTIRSQWADVLTGSDLIILDCLRPVLDALALSEDKDAGRFLVAFDELKREAGISEGIVVHHMGHNGERSRGDSRLLDWPDALWKLVREDSDNPTSPRYFNAYGRDVDVPEARLHYDEATRALTMGLGNRREAKSTALVPEVLEYLGQQTEAVSGRAIEDALTARGHYRDPIRAAIKSAILSGDILTEDGPRRAILHSLNPSVRGSAREFAARTEIECASAPIGRTRTHSNPKEGLSERPAHSTTACPIHRIPLDGQLCHLCRAELEEVTA